MAVDEALESGEINVTTAQRLGITAPPQHHIFPQEEAQWFTQRGVTVDDWTVTLDNATHEAVRLRRRGWWLVE